MLSYVWCVVCSNPGFRCGRGWPCTWTFHYHTTPGNFEGPITCWVNIFAPRNHFNHSKLCCKHPNVINSPAPVWWRTLLQVWTWRQALIWTLPNGIIDNQLQPTVALLFLLVIIDPSGYFSPRPHRSFWIHTFNWYSTNKEICSELHQTLKFKVVERRRYFSNNTLLLC